MPYIDADDFSAYSTVEIGDSDFIILAGRASDIIDMLTKQNISAAGGFDDLSDDAQAAVKKAVCAEVELLYQQGGIDALTGNAESGYGSMSLGKFSVSSNTGNKLEMINGIPISPMVRSYLLMTGLLYRGLDYAAYP